jgi:glycosyltransferase involved in cell wall biosynthesis
MRFSVIMPSRIIPYKGSAQLLDKKIVRAINSVLEQTFNDFELLVISDDCLKTIKIVTSNFEDERLKITKCKHKQLFDNLPRNTGIDLAQGEYIIYCDIDDYWGANHLSIIEPNLKDYDWVWFNDFTRQGNEWQERACNIKTIGSSGTSNICHKRSLGLKWDRPGYAHDFHFNQKLLNFKGVKIETPEYYVMHIPGGYDL